MDELWKDIPGYEGIYQASTHGRVRTSEGKTTHSTRHGERHWGVRVLKPKSCANFRHCGYRVSLWKNKQSKDYLVCRLVATTFLENLIHTKMTVNHKDGDRLNNHIENLEWLTLSDNIRHGFLNDFFSQNHTTLTNIENGEAVMYRSMSAAGKAIGRSSGYISDCRKKDRHAASIDGSVFCVSIEHVDPVKWPRNEGY